MDFLHPRTEPHLVLGLLQVARKEGKSKPNKVRPNWPHPRARPYGCMENGGFAEIEFGKSSLLLQRQDCLRQVKIVADSLPRNPTRGGIPRK